MQCFKPLMINVEGKKFEVPCGKCIQCRIARTREWCIRIQHELIDNPGCFLTFTYRPEDQPKEISKDELVNLIRRLKRMLGETKIKYFACGEYGEESDRPHYHAIIMGWKPEVETLKRTPAGKFYSPELEKIWTKGFNNVGSADREAIQYVTGYIRKKIYHKYPEFAIRQEAFQLQSKGIGKNYVMNNQKLLLEKGVTRNGTNVGLPKYYKKKLFTDENLYYKWLNEAKAELEAEESDQNWEIVQSDLGRRIKDERYKDTNWKGRSKL